MPEKTVTADIVRSEVSSRSLCFLFLLLLTACAPEHGALDLTYAHLASDTPARFKICHGYGCAIESPVSLSAAQWASVTAAFKPPAATPEAEREHIAAAIATMEALVGEATGTHDDQPKAALVRMETGQMDCIDETLNTSRYLHLFAQDNLLHWHSVEQPTRRGYYIDGAWPHNSAVIRDRQTGTRYVVDSWFHANGHEPAILPAEIWVKGWQPES